MKTHNLLNFVKFYNIVKVGVLLFINYAKISVTLKKQQLFVNITVV